MDIPRQHRPAQTSPLRRTVRYTFAFLWTLTLGVSANAVMFWVVDQVFSLGVRMVFGLGH